MRTIRIAVVILAAISLVIPAGCGETQTAEPVTITVRYPSVQQFYRLYGFAFEKKYAPIKVQVLQNEAEPADVLYMHGVDNYERAIREGLLVPLYALTNGKESAFEEQAPLVANLLRSAAPDNHLYAVAPTFHSEVLYYNADLFDEHQVPHPKDHMSWEDVFGLAKQFPVRGKDGQKLYGLQLDGHDDAAWHALVKVGETSGLQALDPDTLQVTMNTERWRAIWDDVVLAFRSGAVYDADKAHADVWQPYGFHAQNAAMMVASGSAAYQFDTLFQMADAPAFRWGMVTAPVNPDNPDHAHFYAIHEYFGVSASSGHPEEAFALLHFIATDADNSKRLAAQHPNRGLPSVLDHIQPVPGQEDLSAMYKLKPLAPYRDPWFAIEPDIAAAFREVVLHYLEQAIAGNITTEDALAEIEAEGQAAIDRIVAQPAAANK